MSKLRLYGSTSGYNELTVPAVADNSEVNIGNLAGNAYVTGTFSSNTYVQEALGNAGLPAGTKQIFVQTAAPTGWTKDTTHNDKALRVVSGTASNGGIDSFSTTFGAGKTTASHTLSTPQIPSHNHSYTRTSPTWESGSTPVSGGYPSNVPKHWVKIVNTGSRGGSQAHSHDLNLDIAYVDVIVATKD